MSTERARPEAERSLGAVGLSRRDFLKISGAGLAGAALLGVAGCGGGGGGGQQGGGGGGGDTLTVGYNQEPAILNSFIVGGDLAATSDMTAGIMQSPLVILPDLSFAPQLADGMPEVLSEDPLTIEYKLKDGLTWSDGEPLTSADAKFTYDLIMDPKNKIITRTGWEDIETFETPDNLTVRMTFKKDKPFAPWRTLLGGSLTQIWPEHIYKGKDFNNVANTEVIGSGPFKFKEWKKGQSLTIERNENYWGDKPALEEVIFRFIPDTNTLTASVQSGEVQFANIPPDIGLLDKLKSFSGVQVQVKAGTVWEHLAFNVEKVPNLNIRRAVAYGINRVQILDKILKGQVEPLQSVLVPDQEPYYTPAWADYAHDPDRAKELVQQAKSEGASTEITFSTTAGDRLRETLQQVVQQQLKDVGITISIENTSIDTFFGQWTVQGKFEMGEWAWLATPDPTSTTLFSADQVPPPDGQNYYRYKNDQVTSLWKESDKTVDVDKRADLIRQAQELMVQDMPLIPMYQRPVYYAFADNLSGPQANPTLAGPFWNIGDWKLS